MVGPDQLVTFLYLGLHYQMKMMNPNKIQKQRQIVLCQIYSQQTFTCSKFTIETLEQGVKYVQSSQ